MESQVKRALTKNGLVYESDGGWYTGIHGDTEVSDVVNQIIDDITSYFDDILEYRD